MSFPKQSCRRGRVKGTNYNVLNTYKFYTPDPLRSRRDNSNFKYVNPRKALNQKKRGGVYQRMKKLQDPIRNKTPFW